MALTTVRSTGIGSLPAISGANLTTLNASNISSGTLNSARFSGGKVLQVVQAEDSTELDLSSNTYTDVGLSASITPSATSSKVLVFWTVHSRFMTTISGFGTRLVRGSTNVWTTTRHYYIYTEDNNNDRHSTMFNYLDSPSTTSATTYKIQVATESSNQVLFNANDNQSIITLMEISA
jgi:hypothetical protein